MLCAAVPWHGVVWLLQVLSSTDGDLLADEIVNESPNPQHATPTEVEVVEETKYDTAMNVVLCYCHFRIWSLIVEFL